MAERKSSATFDGIMRDLKAGVYRPVYVLMGDEPYYIDRISDYIGSHALQPEEQSFNQTVVFGADVTGAQVVDLAREYPMMATRRVVIVKEAQGLKGMEAIEKYFEKPVQSTILVLCHKNGTIDRRKKIIAKAENAGVVFESKRKRDYEIPGFIESYLRQKEVAIDPKSAYMIAEHIGPDLNRLISELDKLLISLSDNSRQITPDMVERQIGVSKDFNSFELRNAVVNRDVLKANQIIKYFDNNPKAGSIYAFLPLLFGYFQNLMMAYYAPTKTESGIAAYLELRSGWAAKEYMTGMRNFSGMKTMQIIRKMREIDAKSKGLDNPNTPAGDLMKELIFFILH